MDLEYFETSVPVTHDIMRIIIAFGWALLIGNLVFQATRSMAAGLGFEGEDPRTLFTRTFVFSFLLVASRPICGIGLGITKTVIGLLSLPDSVQIMTPEESAFGLDAAWLLAVIVGLILIFQIGKLFLEIGERYVITAVLAILSPLAFGMGGSKSTEDIFRGWCRMFGSMCLMMSMNVVFLKLLLSAMAAVPAGAAVLPWMVLVIAIVKAARKIDDIIGRIGLNPARTGAPVNWGVPGMMAMMVARNIGGSIIGAFTGQASHSHTASASRSSSSSRSSAKTAKPEPGKGYAGEPGKNGEAQSAGSPASGSQGGNTKMDAQSPAASSPGPANTQTGPATYGAQKPTRPPIRNKRPGQGDVRMEVDPARAAAVSQGFTQGTTAAGQKGQVASQVPAAIHNAASTTSAKQSAAAGGHSPTVAGGKATAAGRNPGAPSSLRDTAAAGRPSLSGTTSETSKAAAQNPGTHPPLGDTAAAGRPVPSGTVSVKSETTEKTGVTDRYPYPSPSAGTAAARQAAAGQADGTGKAGKPYGASGSLNQEATSASRQQGFHIQPDPAGHRAGQASEGGSTHPVHTSTAGSSAEAEKAGHPTGNAAPAPAHTRQSPPGRSVMPGGQNGSRPSPESTAAAHPPASGAISSTPASHPARPGQPSSISSPASGVKATASSPAASAAGGTVAGRPSYPQAAAPAAQAFSTAGHTASGPESGQPSGTVYTSPYSGKKRQSEKARERMPETGSLHTLKPGGGHGIQDNQHAHTQTRPPSAMGQVGQSTEPGSMGQAGKSHAAVVPVQPIPPVSPSSASHVPGRPSAGEAQAGQEQPAGRNARKPGKGAARRKNRGGGHEPEK